MRIYTLQPIQISFQEIWMVVKQNSLNVETPRQKKPIIESLGLGSLLYQRRRSQVMQDRFEL